MSKDAYRVLRKQQGNDEQMTPYRRLISARVSSKVHSAENDLASGIDEALKQLQQETTNESVGVIRRVNDCFIKLLFVIEELEFYHLCSGLREKRDNSLLLEDFRELDRTRLELKHGAGSSVPSLLKEHASIIRVSS